MRHAVATVATGRSWVSQLQRVLIVLSVALLAVGTITVLGLSLTGSPLRGAGANGYDKLIGPVTDRSGAQAVGYDYDDGRNRRVRDASLSASYPIPNTSGYLRESMIGLDGPWPWWMRVLPQTP